MVNLGMYVVISSYMANLGMYVVISSYMVNKDY